MDKRVGAIVDPTDCRAIGVGAALLVGYLRVRMIDCEEWQEPTTSVARHLGASVSSVRRWRKLAKREGLIDYRQSYTFEGLTTITWRLDAATRPKESDYE